MPTAFDPIELGDRKLTNRTVMSPMTRSRAYGPDTGPTDDVTTYYAQRAGAGQIVTEGTQPNVVGQGYPNTPGLHSDVQVEAWRRVTDAVHASGGLIFAQLMHTGRVGHPSTYADPQTPVGPSPVRAAGQIFTAAGMQDFVAPRELASAEVDYPDYPDYPRLPRPGRVCRSRGHPLTTERRTHGRQNTKEDQLV